MDTTLKKYLEAKLKSSYPKAVIFASTFTRRFPLRLTLPWHFDWNFLEEQISETRIEELRRVKTD